MPIKTHSGIPACFPAGDTIQFTESTPDDASEISTNGAVYRFTNPATGESFKAIGSASGNDYLYVIEGGKTAALKPGKFEARLVIEYSWGRETQSTFTTVELQPNPEAKHEPTHAERMVAALEMYLEGDEQFLITYPAEGQTIDKLDYNAAYDLLKEYRIRVQEERRKRNLALGKASGRRIKTKFVNP